MHANIIGFVTIPSLHSSPMNLIFPRDFLLSILWSALASNSALQLLRSRCLKVHGFPSLVFALGASSHSLWQRRAYIELYFGSSRAFSKTRKMTPFKILSEWSSTSKRSSLNFSNFSGVSLLSIPRTRRKMSSSLSWERASRLTVEGGTQRLAEMARLSSLPPMTGEAPPVLVGPSVVDLI